MSGVGKGKQRLPPSVEPGSIHSNAYNFLSAVNTGVDPRTGMYSASIRLPGVPANNLCGPTVGLTLGFSALNPVDAGFGIGWSLTTTRYDTVRRRLSLSSGESFLVDEFDVATDSATFKDRKLRSFDLIQVSSGGYRVVYKAGHSEHLAVLPGSEGVAVLHELRSPEGYVVKLDQQAAGGIVTLQTITDGTGRVLLGVDYQLYDTRVTLHPGSPQAVSFTFRLGNHWLTHVDLPKGYGDGWIFGYEVRRPSRRSLWRRIRSWFMADNLPKAELELLLLTSIITPTGGREEATYTFEGHALPGGSERPLTHMPYVTTFRRIPGHDQPDIVTRYEYSSHNFFGFGVLDDWLDGEDNLYRVVMPPGQSYEYSSIEKLYDDGDEPVRTIERTFNRFHLLAKELTTQEDCARDVLTIYDEDPSSSFADQVPWCQLPTEVHTTYRRAGASREDVESFTYDRHGNRLTHVDTDGAREACTYYAVAGDEGCPPDPMGFVRCLKETMVTPPEGTEGPIRVTRYRYDLMPSLVTGDPGHMVSVYEGIHRVVLGRVDPLPISEMTQKFVADGGPDHGRLAREVATIGGVARSIDYAYVDGTTEATARGIEEPVVVIIETLTGSTAKDDALCRTTRSARSLLSDMTVMDEGPEGPVTRYAYDALGRSVGTSMAESTSFAAATTVSYDISRLGSSYEACSVTGVRLRSELDGFGRAVRSVAVDWLGDGNDREVWRVRFDTFGRKTSETTTDHGVPLSSGEQGQLSTTTRYAYDAWGNAARTITPDGVIAHVVVDPIARTEETWSEAGASGELSGRLRSRYGKDGRPSQVERCDRHGTLQWWQRFLYDGWGRCLSCTESAPDTPDQTTHYRYDDFDRLTETTLPDGSVVYRGYAAYTDDELVEVIGVRHTPPNAAEEVDTPLGRQAFDALQRRVLFRSGTRETRYSYHASASCEPDRIHLPSGEVLSCTYEKELGYVPTSISDRARSVECRFGYHASLGQLASATSALGRQEVDYLATGQVSSERFFYRGEDAVREATYAYTMLGMGVSYVSVDGESHALRYDEFGRVATAVSDTLVTTFTYDAFSRTQQMTTDTVDGERSMHVSQAYDEHGREIDRVLVARTGSLVQTHTLAQSYTSANKLRKRTWSTDEGTREESYGYDNRGRLVSYECAGIHAPEDVTGAAIASQKFTFDALDNIRTLETTYADAGVAPRQSTFHHSADDPTQLIRLEHAQGGMQEVVLFEYDHNGNLKNDERQRRLIYDPMGRLTRWTQGDGWQAYRYDSLDRVGAVDGPASTRFRYYRDGQVACETSVNTTSSFHTAGGVWVAQSTVDASGRQTVLLGGDAQGSVVSEAGAALTSLMYDLYGYRPDKPGHSDVAYTGELRERDVGWYLLGSFRAYNPVLMRFHSPDPNSPFGHGGLNAYAYVAGDPINRVDPSGETFMDWLPLLIGGIGTAIGIGLSFGTLAPAMVGLWTTLSVSGVAQAASVVSTGLGIISEISLAGSIALRVKGDKTGAGVLGWMSAAYGVGSAVVGLGTIESVATAASSRIDKVHDAYQRLKRLPGQLRNAGGMPSRLDRMGTIEAPRGGAAVEMAVEAVEDAPRVPPVAPGPSGPPRSAPIGIPGSSSRNGAAGLGHASPGRGELPMPRSFRSESDYVSALMRARGRTAGARDLRQAGITDSMLIERLENVALPYRTPVALRSLEAAAVQFRRFTRTERPELLQRALYHLEMARQGRPRLPLAE